MENGTDQASDTKKNQILATVYACLIACTTDSEGHNFSLNISQVYF